SCEEDHGQPPSAGDGVVQFVSASFDGSGGYAIGGVADVEDDQVEVLVNQPLLGCGEVLLGLEVDLPEVCELLGQHFAKVRDHLGVVIDYEHPIRNVGRRHPTLLRSRARKLAPERVPGLTSPNSPS